MQTPDWVWSEGGSREIPEDPPRPSALDFEARILSGLEQTQKVWGPGQTSWMDEGVGGQQAGLGVGKGWPGGRWAAGRSDGKGRPAA